MSSPEGCRRVCDSSHTLSSLAKDVKAIDLRWYIEYEERLQEIGKMLGGWINSLYL